MPAFRRIVHALLLGIVALGALRRAPTPARAADADEKPAGSRTGNPATNAPPRDASPHAPAVRIRGRVVNEAGQPAPGVTVEAFIDQHQTRTIADDNGKFTLDVGRDPPRQINVIATSGDGRLAYYYLRDARPASLTLRPPREMEVYVVDAEGEPVSGASVSAVIYWYQQLAKVTSNARGKAMLRVPADAPLAHLLAKKDGVGFDYLAFRRPNQPPPEFTPTRELLPPESKGPFTLRLDGVLPVTVKVIDEQARPLSGIGVTLTEICRPTKPPLTQIGLGDFKVVTDDDGLARFSAVPKDNESSRRYSATSRDRAWLSSSLGKKEGGPDVIVTMTPRLRLTGRVVLPDGEPVSAAEVTFTSAGHGRGGSITDSTPTDADGNFEYLAVPDQYYLIVASLGSRVSTGVTRVVRRGEPSRVDLTLKEPTRLHGRVTVGPRPLERPLKQSRLDLSQHADIADQDLPEADRLPRPRKVEPRQLRSTYTDDDGNYEFFVGPGNYELIAPARVDSPQFVIAGKSEMEVDVHSAVPDRMKFAGRVVLEENPAVGVPRAQVLGESFEAAILLPIATVCDREGRFEGEVLGTDSTLLWARSEDGQLAGLEVMHVNDEMCVIPLSRACVVRGRLFDASGENQLSGRRIDYSGVQNRGADGRPRRLLGGTTTTDERGDFRLAGLLPGREYEVEVVERGVDGQPLRRQNIATIKPAKGGEIDLGDVAVPD